MRGVRGAGRCRRVPRRVGVGGVADDGVPGDGEFRRVRTELPYEDADRRGDAGGRVRRQRQRVEQRGVRFGLGYAHEVVEQAAQEYGRLSR
ncbi:hypothetical protein TPA0906_33800 [Streptomyces olivaceus]|nr:hypothetical protein TPA0906_33800 [Streptomyces olivaceus]